MSLVCWSGGADSTLVLYDLAEKSSAAEPVNTVSFRVSQVGAEREQARARERILKEFKKRDYHVNSCEIDVKVTKGSGMDCHGLPQAAVWTLGIQVLGQEEDLYLGYIKGDDWTWNRAEYVRVFEAWQHISARTGNLFTPLGLTPKHHVLDRLEDARLLHLVWWCECLGRSPVNTGRVRTKPCGDCESCRTHETAMMVRERWKK